MMTNHVPTASDSSAARRSPGVVKNGLINYGGQAISMVALLLLVPYMIRHLGQDGYGIWALVGTFIAQGSLFDLGFASAITKFVSEYESRGELADSRGLVSAAALFYVMLSLLVVVAGFLVAPHFPRWFSVPPEMAVEAQQLVILCSLSFAVAMVGSTVFAALEGLQRFDIVSLLGVVRVLIFSLGVVVVLQMGFGLVAVALCQIGSRLVVLVPALCRLQGLAPELRFARTLPNPRKIGQVVSFSWALFLARIGGHIQTQVDEIVVGAKLAIGAVTPYAVALRLAEIPQRLAQQYLRLLMPLASSVHATEGEDERLRSIFVTSTRLTAGIVFGAGLLLAMLAPQVLTLWIGEDFRVYAGLVAVLVLALGLDLVQWPAGEILQGINRHRIFAVTALVTGGVNLGLSLLLVERFGLIGVAWGTAIPAALELGFVIWPFAVKTLGLSRARLLREGLLPGLTAAVPSALVVALVLRLIPDARVLLELLAAATLGGATFVAVYLAMPPSVPERALLRTAFDSLAGRRPEA